jgi:hypothetical protein
MTEGQAMTKPSEVLLDYAATSHMFSDAGFFTRYTSSNVGETVSVGNGKDIPVAGSTVQGRRASTSLLSP